VSGLAAEQMDQVSITMLTLHLDGVSPASPEFVVTSRPHEGGGALAQQAEGQKRPSAGRPRPSAHTMTLQKDTGGSRWRLRL
jgi:hypothetical protein